MRSEGTLDAAGGGYFPIGEKQPFVETAPLALAPEAGK
jgi:hypothetical protein